MLKAGSAMLVGEHCNFCPQCQQELAWQKGTSLGQGNYICHACQLTYQKQNYCPDCQEEVEKLQACGATNYFCKKCNSLKSKSRVTHDFKELAVDE